MEAPQYPIGPMVMEEKPDAKRRAELIAEIEAAPVTLRKALVGLSEAQLGTVYKNWTIRQIANHLADSHVNAYIRMKKVLTEDSPLAVPYDMEAWNALADAQSGDLDATMSLLEGLHKRWVVLLRSMTEEQFARTFKRPDGTVMNLARNLCIYAWHGRHHTGQVLWLRQQHGW